MTFCMVGTGDFQNSHQAGCLLVTFRTGVKKPVQGYYQAGYEDLSLRFPTSDISFMASDSSLSPLTYHPAPRVLAFSRLCHPQAFVRPLLNQPTPLASSDYPLRLCSSSLLSLRSPTFLVPSTQSLQWIVTWSRGGEGGPYSYWQRLFQRRVPLSRRVDCVNI